MFINESEERLEEVARSFRTAVLSRDSKEGGRGEEERQAKISGFKEREGYAHLV